MEENYKVHEIGISPPFKCKICGSSNNEKLIMLFYYRGEKWLTASYCSEKCFEKTNIPYQKIKPKSGFLKKLKGYRFYKTIKNKGLEYVFPVKEYLIDDRIEFDPYEIFDCL